MEERILSNVKANLKFYSRNGIIWIVILIMLMQVGARIFFYSYAQGMKFEILRSFLGGLGGFFSVIVAVLGMLTVSYHLRNRCFKMVFSRPCSPDRWLFSLFLSVVIVSASLIAVALLSLICLFIAWKIPFQAGCIYILLHSMCRWILLSFCLLFLSVFLNPALSVFLVAVLTETNLYRLTIMLGFAANRASSSAARMFLKTLWHTARALYMSVPLSLYPLETGRIASNWITSGQDWMRLGIVFLYTFCASCLLFFLSSSILGRKRLI